MEELNLSDEVKDILHNLKVSGVNMTNISDLINETIKSQSTNNIKLEIAPRETGKTHRMCLNIKNFIEGCGPKDKRLVVVKSIRFNNNIKSYLSSMGVSDNDISNHLQFSTTMNEPGYYEESYIYVDDFDFIDRDKLFICNNGYYNTTLRNGEGDDFTKSLYKKYLLSKNFSI